MDFWNSALTEKSWSILLELRRKKFEFILIGGWAAYLWTNLHKSKDIDIVIKNFEDLIEIKKDYELKKNDNLKKYEIQVEEIDIDIYAPFFSKLTIPVEEIKNYATRIQNFQVVRPEALLLLKQGAELDRKDSVKGQKDRVDIMTLLCYSDINFEEYFRLLKRYSLNNFHARLKSIISTFKEINYLSLNPRQFKIKKEKIMKNLK